MNQQIYLEEVAEECMQILDNLSIQYGNVVDFTINTRAKKRWGQCKIKPDGYHININYRLCDGQHEDGLRNTLYHELLHTCKGCMNHGNEWKRLCGIVKEGTGYEIRRTNSAEDKGLEEEPVQVVIRPAKYLFKCKNCGKIYTRQKVSKLVQHPEWYRCSKCGTGMLERV